METNGKRSYKALLERSVSQHGHLCAGQIIGVRMSMLGLKLVGLENPDEITQLKKLIVFVEMDRCAADAVQAVTNCRLGRRSLKYRDYGIMAATFVNLSNGAAVRIVSREDTRDAAAQHFPEISNVREREMRAYPLLTDAQLFDVYRVQVDLSETMMPGPTRSKVVCAQCGIVVRDGREVKREGQTLCHPCAGDSYFSLIEKVYLENNV